MSLPRCVVCVCVCTGWAVALACYPPFVHSALDAYCTYHSPKNAWGVYFKHSPRWLFWCWGTGILALSTVYTWATIVFGMRFSNLTNRVREDMCSRQTDLMCLLGSYSALCTTVGSVSVSLLSFSRSHTYVTHIPFSSCHAAVVTRRASSAAARTPSCATLPTCARIYPGG